ALTIRCVAGRAAHSDLVDAGLAGEDRAGGAERRVTDREGRARGLGLIGLGLALDRRVLERGLLLLGGGLALARLLGLGALPGGALRGLLVGLGGLLRAPDQRGAGRI